MKRRKSLDLDKPENRNWIAAKRHSAAKQQSKERARKIRERNRRMTHEEPGQLGKFFRRHQGFLVNAYRKNISAAESANRSPFGVS